MTKCRFGSVVLGILFLSLAAVAQSTDQSREFHWKGHLPAEGVVIVKNVSGNIEADSASGDEIEVTAEKSGDRAEEARIQMIQSGDSVTFCAVLPGWFNDRCESDHSMLHHNEGRKVRFTIHVPENLRFTGENVNGDVIAENLGRFVKADSVNGKIRVSTKSWAEVSSVNGSLQAKMGRADWSGTLKLSTVNGSIELELPSDANTDVNFKSVNGRLRTEFPINVEGTLGGRMVKGQIGTGGRELVIDTVNGGCEIRRAGL